MMEHDYSSTTESKTSMMIHAIHQQDGNSNHGDVEDNTNSSTHDEISNSTHILQSSQHEMMEEVELNHHQEQVETTTITSDEEITENSHQPLFSSQKDECIILMNDHSSSEETTTTLNLSSSPHTSTLLGNTTQQHPKGNHRSLPPIDTSRNLQLNLEFSYDRRATPVSSRLRRRHHHGRNSNHTRDSLVSQQHESSLSSANSPVMDMMMDSAEMDTNNTTTINLTNNTSSADDESSSFSNNGEDMMITNDAITATTESISSALTSTPTRVVVATDHHRVITSQSSLSAGVSPFLFPSPGEMFTTTLTTTATGQHSGSSTTRENDMMMNDEENGRMMMESTFSTTTTTEEFNEESIAGNLTGSHRMISLNSSTSDHALSLSSMDHLETTATRHSLNDDTTTTTTHHSIPSLHSTPNQRCPPATSLQNPSQQQSLQPQPPLQQPLLQPQPPLQSPPLQSPLDLESLLIHPSSQVPSNVPDIPNHFQCPITKLIMHAPVKNIYDKTYERESIEQWWKTLHTKQQPFTDPLTNQNVSDRTLHEDVDLKNQIQEFLNENPHLRFSINEIYFPKQIIREMKIAIDNDNIERVRFLLSQFPANFFVQTKFPIPHSTHGKPSRSEKETSVSIFDCLYRKFKNVYDAKIQKSPMTQQSLIMASCCSIDTNLKTLNTTTSTGNTTTSSTTNSTRSETTSGNAISSECSSSNNTTGVSGVAASSVNITIPMQSPDVIDRNHNSHVHFKEEDFIQSDPILALILKQYKIVREYCIARQQSTSKVERSEYKIMENAIKDGLKNIFVNSVRMFPSTSIIDWLISMGASLSSTNQFRQNAFHMACMTDQLEIAKHLYHLNYQALGSVIENSQVPTSTTSTNTTSNSSCNNQTTTLTTTTMMTTTTTTSSSNNSTTLHHGGADLIQPSISVSTHSTQSSTTTTNIVEERLSDEVKRKWNAFYLAIWHNSNRIVEWMINDPHLSSKFLSKKLKCMVKDKSNIYHPMNALSLAVYKRNIPLVETLITKFGFDVSDEKLHPIYWSCIANDLNGFEWICDFILKNYGPDALRKQLKSINERAFRRSLIHAISMEASDEMMEYLLQKCKEFDVLDVVINSQDNFGNTALHYACEKSKTKTIQCLIREGIAHECINRQGKTASQCCKTDDDRIILQKAIREERELLKKTMNRVKDLEDDVSFLKRKLLEMEQVLFVKSNKKNKEDDDDGGHDQQRR
ncbi:hypothetical protein FDP41_013550 [Naegleria fowleri]|uniref:U-box domain-containing protein n=1 Tax=Naegleria fowleri TaxID=5763 RepID=A0A6A5BY98_NAEFO|nr:uncharacterized protein FDP41_013550 [Naegleria fowleri]KAF0980336.1 hypothetical protein FDP41_013550 [Naegleria fowleri]